MNFIEIPEKAQSHCARHTVLPVTGFIYKEVMICWLSDDDEFGSNAASRTATSCLNIAFPFMSLLKGENNHH
jgi:hypothetical protein